MLPLTSDEDMPQMKSWRAATPARVQRYAKRRCLDTWRASRATQGDHAIEFISRYWSFRVTSYLRYTLDAQ
jgi:hypothetical protein